MFEELQKRSFKSSLFGAIILMLIGLGLMGWNLANVWYVITGYAKFENLVGTDIKSGILVDIDLDYHLGLYLAESKRSSSGKETPTYNYYLIDTWPTNEFTYDSLIMAIKVPASYKSKMNNMDSQGYLKEIIPFSGKIKKLSGEDYDYYYKALKQAGATDEDIKTQTIPYYIDVYNNKTVMNVVYIVVFLGGVALLAAGILKLVKAANGGGLKKLRQDIADAGYSESTIESDYRNAYSFSKSSTLKMGELMTYYTIGAEPRAICNNKMMWAYQNTITHRTNGIKTGTSYNVIIYAESAKDNACTLYVPNEATAQEMLQRISDRFPWVVVGYTDELKRLFNQERAQFLEIRYNTCEHNAVEPGYQNVSIGS